MSSLKIQSLFHKAHGLLVRQGCLKCALIETFSHKSSQQKIERTDLQICNVKHLTAQNLCSFEYFV